MWPELAGLRPGPNVTRWARGEAPHDLTAIESLSKLDPENLKSTMKYALKEALQRLAQAPTKDTCWRDTYEAACDLTKECTYDSPGDWRTRRNLSRSLPTSPGAGRPERDTRALSSVLR